MAAPAASGRGGWAREDEQPASERVVSRHCLPREREEYAARRALFLQSYRLSTRVEEDDAVGMRGRVVRWVRDASMVGKVAATRAASQARGAARWWVGAGLGRAWHGWKRPLQLRVHGVLRHHQHTSLLGLGFGSCFGGRGSSREYHFLEGFA